MPMLRRRWTVADLHDLPETNERYEVIDGALFVTPAPSWPHQRAVAELHRLLQEYVTAHLIGCAYFAPADVVFSQQRGVQPDVFVVPLVNGRRPDSFDEAGRLLLAAEVLSPATARADRVAKRTLYKEEGVPEYWVVDLDARTFERTTPGEPRAEVLTERIEWAPASSLPPLVIDVPAFFARVLDG